MMFNLTFFIFLWAAAFNSVTCFATVFEFDQNGEVTVYDARDYLTSSRHKQGYLNTNQNISEFRKLNSLPFSEYIDEASLKYNVSPDLIHAVIKAESAYNPYAISPQGAQGLMQLMPDTAMQYGVTDSFSPEENIKGGTKYLKFLLDRYDGDINLAVAAYNAGEGAVDKYGDIPPYPETKAYVQKVSLFLEKVN